MMEKHSALFKEFKVVHDQYVENPERFKAKFNELGNPVVDIIREYENRLCSHSEGGIYSKYSQNLSDKFWAEVRRSFSKIDFVGVK